MDEQQSRELYVRLKMLNEQMQQLEQHASEIDDKTVELRRMIDAVKEAQTIADDDELLVPLTNGIFLPVKAKQVRTLMLNVGADSIVSRTPEQTIDILEKQQRELAEYREKVLMQQHQIHDESSRIERMVEED